MAALHGAALGGLEVRAEPGGGARIVGRFPYGAPAELAPQRLEVFAPGSLEPRGDVYLLSQHDFRQPLASTAAGSLELRAEPEALALSAEITPKIAGTTHARDALALIKGRLAVGLSPGFRVAPGGERIEKRGEAILRTVTRAELVELSIVTRPAYPAAAVEARSWQPVAIVGAPRRQHPSGRWR